MDPLSYHIFFLYCRQGHLLPSVLVDRHFAVGVLSGFCLSSIVSYDLPCWTLRTDLIPGVLENQHLPDASNVVQKNRILKSCNRKNELGSCSWGTRREYEVSRTLDWKVTEMRSLVTFLGFSFTWNYLESLFPFKGNLSCPPLPRI